MAKPVSTTFGKFRVLLGDDSDPIVYAAPCGFTSKSFNRTKNLSEQVIPDCDDPDAAADIIRDVVSKDWSIGGEGLLAAGSAMTWEGAYDSDVSVPVKIEIEFSTGTLTYTGRAHLNTFNVTGEQGGRVTASVEMSADGGLTRVSTLP